jgi:ATP-binding cassette subfamily C protein
MLRAYTQVRASLVSVDVVDRDLSNMKAATPALPAERPGTPDPWPAASPRQLVLEDVWYRYPGAEGYALAGVDLVIRRGEAIGIVGPSGAGKSTLVDVLLGILPPERGAVRADGVDVQECLGAWHRVLGYVPQSIYLFDGTLQQNIALGLDDEEVDPEALQRALDAANLSRFVAGLPEGLQTPVGERGVRISGGQRQRVAIARALYQDPRILLMDEATSALDNVTEKAVMEAVDSLKGERTVLLIAHRLTSVRNCDRIVYMQEGRVAAVGTYEDLIRSSPGFQQLAAGTA